MNNAPPPRAAESRRRYILAALRRASIKAQLVQLDIEFAASALQHNIATPEQTLMLVWTSEAGRFFDLDVER